MTLKQNLQQLRDALKILQQAQNKTNKTVLTDFKSQQTNALKTTIENSLAAIEKELQNTGITTEHISAFRKATTIDEKLAAVDALSELVATLPDDNEHFTIPSISFPAEIRDEMNADIRELKKCFANECYRSTAILCGRLLETALHRRYFEVAGNDLLEKSPGMGLGNLIARIEEKGIKLDPGLTNQIHLINQVRIYSVHKKQESFNPTKMQAQAIILYTIDVLKRLAERG
ncbi:hypothetical protein HY485_02230 [Candidatus Woesearchaeota archaeon]|nr:hypothetical protein [Candidatus Woesearchaeota archaeon]